MSLKDRFMGKVEKTESCWLWTGCTSAVGYGRFTVSNKVHNAHRISYELFVGQIPEEKKLWHTCHNRTCVNPDHLGILNEDASQGEITADRLREVLDYDKDTGVFRWGYTPFNKRVTKGDVAGCVGRDGYIFIKIDGQNYVAHRLAYLWMTGSFPDAELDHRDRSPANNRWSNLRPATRRENMRNTGKNSNNTSGVKGVSWHPDTKKWQASIRANDRNIYLGVFETIELATEFRRLAAEMLHGEFVNHGD